WLWYITKMCGYKHICIVAGNHDFVFQNRSTEVKQLLESVDGVHYLCDSSVEIEGHIFYGSPWCPQLRNWAFYKNREDLMKIFDTMPQNIDVLLTHCPPDINQIGVVLQRNYNYLSNFGSWELSQALRTRNIKWVVSGHIHSGDHEVSIYNNDICIMNLVNVSMKDEDYEIRYKPFVFEL
ncbi:MAG: metallophosphoesterase, partial [Parabacteroides sp.]|nr:metallophosphoesterase [Parabacteroides sp.]